MGLGSELTRDQRRGLCAQAKQDRGPDFLTSE